MTDTELSAAVARVEGWEKREYPPFTGLWWRHADHDDGHWHVPPYATEWAWCGPLVEKYGVSLHLQGVMWQALVRSHFYHWDATPQRAVCLAVLAAQEGR